MFKLSNTRNLLFLLFPIYYLQGVVYPKGSTISQLCLFLILLICSWLFVKTLLLKERKPLFYKAWTALLLLNIVGFIFTANYSDPMHLGAFKEILGCLLPFYAFYYFSKKGCLESKHLITFFLIILPVTILFYFANRYQILLNRSMDGDLVNNVAYSFVRLIPFVFLIKEKKLLSLLSFMLLFIFIIAGAKRGAFIAGGIYFLLYFYYQLKTIDKRQRNYYYFLIIIVLSAFLYYVYSTVVSNEFFMDRLVSMAEGDSSGRDWIYQSIWNEWYKSESYLNILLGYGFASSLGMTGGFFAHNDWLELLSSFGLIGVAVYLFLFYAVFKTIRNKQLALDKRYLLFSITIVWLFISFFSMWYTTMGSYTQAILLAYLTQQTSSHSPQKHNKLSDEGE
ncbi:O-antigen ligase family protein [Massilibacteroides vaginae]|uniref:O-antigen ligase family protein n=1 Tax=Massilibacteroides vaginae TaxID=1673718 RepID=UPI000A1CA230|nr:O-antigen ligase family protein [Massilibacteroides vaginae]